MSTNDVLVLLSVVLALVVVGVLAAALIEVRRGLLRISAGLAALGSALEGVEAEHLRPLEGAVKAINAQFDVILAAMPGIAGKVGANTANIPQLEATAPVLALIVDEAVVQDGYMNALTDGFGGK